MMQFPNDAWNDYDYEETLFLKAEAEFCEQLARMIREQHPDYEETLFLVIDGENAPKGTHEGEYMCCGYYTCEDGAPYVELYSTISVDSETLIIVAGA